MAFAVIMQFVMMDSSTEITDSSLCQLPPPTPPAAAGLKLSSQSWPSMQEPQNHGMDKIQ